MLVGAAAGAAFVVLVKLGSHFDSDPNGSGWAAGALLVIGVFSLIGGLIGSAFPKRE